MIMSKFAAKYLKIWFELIINDTKLLQFPISCKYPAIFANSTLSGGYPKSCKIFITGFYACNIRNINNFNQKG